MTLKGSTGDVSITNCTFQNNIATAGDGGAMWLGGITGYVSITNCTFQNNSAANGDYGGGAVALMLESTSDVSITNCQFEDNSAIWSLLYYFGGGAVSLYGTGNFISITDCTFQNSATDGSGGAVMLFQSTGYVSIINCTFQNNTGTTGGAVMFDESTGDVSITNCTFQRNTASHGDGGAMWLDKSTGYVSITNSAFQKNSATNGQYGGGAVISLASDVSITNCQFEDNSAIMSFDYYISLFGGGAVSGTGNVISITDCTFQNNSATFSGGALWLYVVSTFSITFSIKYCTFQNNSATYDGGAVGIASDTNSEVVIDASTFINNAAVRGAAVYASLVADDYYQQLGSLILQDVRVENNQCFCNGYQSIRGGAIYFNGMNVTIMGDTPTGSQFLSNSPLGAIQGENGFLKLNSNISFTNNTGENGGAIGLSNVPLYFYGKQGTVDFSRNVATGFGGAIYNGGSLMPVNRDLSRCSIFFSDPSLSVSNYITFTGNHAMLGGHSIYATPIYGCWCIEGFMDNCGMYNLDTLYTRITPLPQDINATQVLSFPTKVQLCNCSDPDLCNVISQYQGKVTTYPGRSVRINVTSVDDGNNLSPSVVYASTDTIALGPGQEAQWVGKACGAIEYQIYGSEMTSLNLTLFTYPGSFPTVIEVELLPCELGFIFMPNYSKCGCYPFLVLHAVVCDTSDGTVIRNKPNWIGVYNNTLPALASICPLDYCNSTINKLSLGRPEDLCNEGRTGILCGQCHGNYSVIFGSSQCQVCSDMWLITLVMFAVLGVLLVAALFFLNLTVTQGTLYGLIFYANIIQVNTSVFFSQSNLRPLQVILSLVNLDLGIPLCFYDDMDDADKTGLQFVFPAYLLILTMTVIVLCHYCLQRSPTMNSTRSCVYRFFFIIGQRAVGVLTTLIYLSYSKLLRTVIDIFTYSTVHLPTGDMYVWFYDGNVEYLQGKHTVLFVFAMVTCVLFLLPYTFALTFIPIIEHYSEHNRLFNYLHKKANQIKPMIDAHYAPYKGEWRWWLGARLWLLVVMYILNPVLRSYKPSLLLSIQATMVILFTVVQAGIKPFEQSLQKSDKFKRHSNMFNQLYNILDLFYLLNYIALSLLMSYILDQSSDQTQPIVVSVGVLVGLYVVVVMVTVLYHIIGAILKACGIYDRAREKIDGLFQKKCELVVPASIEPVHFALREPLLCED